MRFTRDEIELAQELKRRGLPWTPAVGHFVWDLSELIEAGSPFHDRVFFILDLKHFLRRSKTIEALADACCWLPTWHDAREILQSQNIDNTTIAKRISEERAIENGCELMTLYRMIQESMAT